MGGWMKRQPLLPGSVPMAFTYVKNIKSIWLIPKRIKQSLAYNNAT